MLFKHFYFAKCYKHVENLLKCLCFSSRSPTPEITSLLDVSWQPVEENKTNYLDIDIKLTMRKDYEQERMAFWDSVYSSTNETKSKL